jgi:TolA-binding protein
VEAYSELASARPADADTQSSAYQAGTGLLRIGRPEQAREALLEASSGPDHLVAEQAAWQRIALIPGASDDLAPALESFVGAFPASAHGEEAARLAASLRTGTGDWEQALGQWDFLLTRFPKSPRRPEYLYQRGRAFLTLGRMAPGLDDLQQVITVFPGSPWSFASAYGIGWAYAQRGEYPRALQFFQAAARDPSGGDASERGALAAGLCLFNMGRFDGALEALHDLQRRVHRSVSDGTIVIAIGRTLYRMGRLEAAADSLEKAAASLAQDDPLSADAQYWLGWSYLRLGRLIEARDRFLSLAQQFPSDPRSQEAVYRAGVCNTLRADDAGAVTLFARVLDAPRSRAVDPIREQSLYESGRALSRLGREAASSATFEELAREYPSGQLAAQAFFRIAEKSLDAGRYAEALAGFRRVARDFPDSDLAGQAQYWAAQTRLLSGDLSGAAAEFWAEIQSRPQPGLMAAAIDGFSESLRSLNDPAAALDYARKARAEARLPAGAAAAVELAAAEVLLLSSPEDSLALIGEVRAAAPGEPVAGQAMLLLAKYNGVVGNWNRSLGILGALVESRSDEVGARAALEHARALEATGRTSEAVEEFKMIPTRFPVFPDLAAEGLYNGVRLALARGETERAANIRRTLLSSYPKSSWARLLGSG